jgi:serine phosphatase RsbU (regulator of sigma subunit)
VPLRTRGAIRGVLAAGVDSREPGDADFVRGALEDVALVAAPALEAARLSDERAAVSRTLQRSLLPPALPSIPGVEVAARYVAGGEGSDVGGDFYDCFATGDGAWGVAIGDVSGRGADAAAVTALARCTLRATVLHERRPDAVLRELNAALLEQATDFRFCTMLYLVLRPRPDGSADARLASGGHPLPLHLRAAGTVAPAGRAGTLLGVVADPDVRATDVHLAPGDALVLFTDGAVAGDAAVPEALAEFLRACAERDAEAIAAGVQERALAAAANGRLRDDAAVVVLRAAPV